MTPPEKNLYSDAAAERPATRQMRQLRLEETERFGLIVENLGEAKSLLDVGCGAGVLMALAAERGLTVVGIDNNLHRIEEVTARCPSAEILLCAARDIAFPGRWFDVITALQMLHEVVLIGGEAELDLVLSRLRRLLATGGRLMAVDHLDPDDGDGLVTVRGERDAVRGILTLAERFRYRPMRIERLGDDGLRLSRRNLQDAVTKLVWLDTAAEAMEMNETHCCFRRDTLTGRLEAAGFSDIKWQTLEDIGDDLARAGLELTDAAPWQRKFFVIATK